MIGPATKTVIRVFVNKTLSTPFEVSTPRDDILSAIDFTDYFGRFLVRRVYYFIKFAL